MEDSIMSQKLSKQFTNGDQLDQLSLPFESSVNDNCHVSDDIQNNVIRFNNIQCGRFSNKANPERDRIIKKLLSHANKLRW